MPAAPKEKATSTSREKGKGKEKDHDGGGNGKEPKQRKKPGRVPTSCAECRRLKLRCDRNVPCAKCVSRGCGSICPDGTLAPGKGNRLVLANTEELHARIDAMADRNKALEKALADLFNQSREAQGGVVHPLLAEGRLELGDLGRLSVAGGSGGLGSTSESSRSSLMIPTPSPRASTSASTNSPTSQSHSYSQSRSPAPERQNQTSTSTSQPQRWREIPAASQLRRPEGDDAMELDLDPDDGHDKESDEMENDDAVDENLLHDLDATGTLFVGDSNYSQSKGGGAGAGVAGGGRTSYYYLGRSARPEFLAQIIPATSTPSPSFSSLAQIRAIFPERDAALSLCDVYLAYGTSVYISVLPRAQLEQVLRGVYRAMEHSASASSSLLCDMAFLLAAFALGALFSPALAPYSDEARNYYTASQSVLDMLSEDTNEMVVHTLLHLTQFAELVSTATSPSTSTSAAVRRATSDSLKLDQHDAAWAHAGHGVRLAQRMGMHISPSRWPGISEDAGTSRDSLWWALFVADTWTSLDFGRPSAASRSYADCAIPPNRTLPSHVDLVASDSDSIFHSWYLHFTILLHDALGTIVAGTKPTTAVYASVLEHDRRIRDFYVPRAWRMSSAFSSASVGQGHSSLEYKYDDGFTEDDEDPDGTNEDMAPQDPRYRSGSNSDNGRKKDEEEMYRWLVLSAKEIVLLKLHQPYFVQALKPREPTATDDDNETIRHTVYLPSILAVCRSIRRLSKGLAHTWAVIPKFLARVGVAWSHGLSAAVTAALLVARAPESDLASGALDELAALASVFGAAAPVCTPAANMLDLVRNLHQTAAHARSRRYRSSDHRPSSISFAELERLNGQTTSLNRSTVLPSASQQGNLFDQSSLSPSLIISPQHLYQPKTYDYERPRSRATSATMSDFATDTHYNQPHTLTHLHNAPYTQQAPHGPHGSQIYKIPRQIMDKLHPTLAQDLRLFKEQGTSSNIGVTFHDTPSDAANSQKETTPQRRKLPEKTSPYSPHAIEATDSLPTSTYHSQPAPSYRNPTPPPNQSHYRSYPQSSLSEGHYHSQQASPNPPRLIADPYMSPKPHTTSTSSSMQYLDNTHQRGHAYPGSHSYPETEAHISQQANSYAPPNVYQRQQREQQSYHYADIDDDDLSTITSGFYASESRMRSGVGSHGNSGIGGSSIHLNSVAPTAGSVTNISTTTTTTATMSTSTSGGFMPHPFVLGPLPNGFQSGFFPAGFSSGFYPSPIVLDPSWNSFVEQLGF